MGEEERLTDHIVNWAETHGVEIATIEAPNTSLHVGGTLSIDELDQLMPIRITKQGENMSKGRTIAVSNSDIEILYKATNYYHTMMCEALESIEEELETTRNRLSVCSNPIEKKVFEKNVNDLEFVETELTSTKNEVSDLLGFLSNLRDDEEELTN